MSAPGAPAWARAAREAPGLWHSFAALAERAQRDGLTHTLVCGMGGSSLTAGVLAAAFNTPHLQTLDTTAPRTVLAAARHAESVPTLFVIASKTGTTVETDAMYRFFAARARPDQFIAITDPGSALDAMARERGFRASVLAPPEVGGRYSALTAFGLVPAALAGIDGAELLRRAAAVDEGGARAVGARIADSHQAGRDKLALEPPRSLHALGPWIEQVVAESSGKDGRGVVPLLDDPGARARGDTQIVTDFARDPNDLGVEFARWAYATDEVCRRLGVNAYDQPDVDSAKTQTRALLAADPRQPLAPVGTTMSITELAACARPGDYLALLLYLPADAETSVSARALRAAWCRATGVATTVGYGPTYLHSTGQLHKGGPNTGLYLVVTADDDEDAAIPGLPFTFGRLQRAQALGDVAALQARGRRVAYAHLSRASELTLLVP